MKKKTGFTDHNNKEICVGDKVRICPNCGYRKSGYFSINNGYEGIVEEDYEGIVEEDNDKKEDRYRIVHPMGNAKSFRYMRGMKIS